MKKLLEAFLPRRRGLDRRSRLVVVMTPVVATVLALAAVAPARAELTLQLVPALGVGVTDNAASSTAPAPRETDGFGTAAVTATGRLSGALTTHLLTYHVAYTQFFQSLGPTTLTNALAWTSSYRPTARLELGLTATAALSRLSRVDVNDLTTVVPQATVGGTTQFFSTALTQTLVYQPTATRTVDEGLTVAQVRYFDSVQDLPTTTFALARVKGTQLVGRNNFSLELQMSDSYTPVDPAMAVGVFASGHTLIGRLLAGWQRDLSVSWNAAIAAGPMIMLKPEGPGVIAPNGIASLNYASRPWFATLSVAQQAAPNIFLGEATINDQVLARVALPLTRSELVFVTGFASYVYARIANDQGNLGRAFDSRMAGVAVSGRLQSLPFAATLQYTIVDQDGGAVAGRVVQDFFRQVLLLNVSGVFLWGKGTPPLFGGGP